MVRAFTFAALLITGLAACGGGRSVGGEAGQDASGADGALPACGDKAVMARFAECQKATTQPACEAAGGTWTAIGLYPEKLCVCPTGQGGCPCDRASQCLGSCRAEMVKMWDCAGVKGSCAPASPHVGCYCWFDDDGDVDGICAD